MKKMLSMLLALILVFSLVGCSGSSGDSGTADTGGDSSAAEESDVIKIGLYTPLTGTSDVTVTLDYDGELTCVYPVMNGNSWMVTASPDGTLTDAVGQTYNYLYWEGVSRTEYDFSQGFCVPGRDTAAFLEDTLATLGLNRREANEFIVYWLPHMEGNAYNLIAFQTSSYTDHARLTADPAPDTVLRVFMAWKPLDRSVELPPQTLAAPVRTGFTLVEWGGAEIS